MAHSCCCQFRCHQNLSEALLMTFANLLASVGVVFPFPSFLSPVFFSISFIFFSFFFSFAFYLWHFLPTFAFTCDFHDLPPHRIESRIKNTFILPQPKKKNLCRFGIFCFVVSVSGSVNGPLIVATKCGKCQYFDAHQTAVIDC